MYNAIVCRYHEIATKGHNRCVFEQRLMDNLQRALRRIGRFRVRRVRGRIWIEPEAVAEFTAAELEQIQPLIAGAFGLESASPAIRLPAELEAIKTRVGAIAPALFAPFAGRPGETSFRIRARRSDKKFPFRSAEVEVALAAAFAEAVGPERLRVDLEQAEITIGCEIRHEFALLFFESWPGPGGLPVGSNPRVLTLLSGGIDSPVAAYQVMKRGCPTDFITFHSAPYTPPETVEKVRGIARKLNEFQWYGVLHVVNLAPFQKLVRDCCNERVRTVLYRRAMFRIAEAVARQGKLQALVTGESVGQVASQTITNLDTINAVVDLLVLRPLAGSDKLEAIRLAEKIGTLAMSEVAVPDSCTVFAPASPSTAVPRAVAEAEEAKIPEYDRVLAAIIADSETIDERHSEPAE